MYLVQRMLPAARLAAMALLAIAMLGFATACGDDDDGGSAAQETQTSTTARADIPYQGIESNLATSYPEPKPAAITIGWSNPLGANEGLTITQDTAEAWAKKYGGKLLPIDAQGDPNKQVSDIQQLISQKVDVIVAYPLDANALNPILERAKDAGIPVIGEDVTSGTDPGPLWTSQVIQRRDHQAYSQAKIAAELLPEGAEVGFIGFAVPVPALRYYKSRQRYWAKKFGLKPGADADNPSDDIAGGEKAMTQLLGKAPNIKGVLAYNEESATGAQAAARQAGKRDLVLIGTNGGTLGFNSVRDGKIAATVQIQIASAARLLVQGAYDAAAGVKIPRTVVTPETKTITKDTIHEIPTAEEAAKQELASG